MKRENLSRAGFAACAAVLLSLALAAAPSAQAASSSARATKAASSAIATAAAAATEAKDPQTTSSVGTEEDRCQRSRKRLWVEGEGWVVRRVTTCF